MYETLFHPLSETGSWSSEDMDAHFRYGSQAKAGNLNCKTIKNKASIQLITEYFACKCKNKKKKRKAQVKSLRLYLHVVHLEWKGKERKEDDKMIRNPILSLQT